MSDTRLTTVLKAALQYRAEGRSVFPIVNKQPKVKWKELQSRLATEAELIEWFGQNPSLQIAMVMGRISGGIWVMDADGMAAVDWLKHNAPATTVYARTKRGLHAYYLNPPGIEVRSGANVILDLKKSTGHQIDVKGEGGYTVVPPSPFRGGEYRWEISGEGWAGLTAWQPPNQTKIAMAAWSGHGDLNLDLSDVRPARDYRPAPQGERNSALASIAGSMIARGLTAEEVLIWALGWNMGCNPPMSEEEVRRTVESIANIHLRNYGSLPVPIVEVSPEVKRRTKQPDGIPDEILKPGGVMEMIMDYAKKSTVANFNLFSMVAALATVGSLVGQKVMTETGLRTNLYIFALAPSGTGKNTPMSAIRKLLFEADCSDYLGPSHLASDAALVSALSSRDRRDGTSMLLFIDEIGDLIGAVKNKNNLAKNGLIHLLKELYSATDTIYTKSYANANNDIVINYPHLSFYATGVPARFWGNLNYDDIIDGFLPRSLVFNVDLEVTKRRKPIVDNVPENLIKAVRSLAQITPSYVGNMRTTPNPLVVRKTPAAESYFDKWDDHLIEMQNKYRHSEDGRGAIYNRAAEHAHKIALIHAVSLAGGIPGAVDMSSVQYAINLLDWCLPQMIVHITENISHNEQDSLRKRILAMVDKKGSVTKRDVYTNLHGCNSKMAEDAIRILEECGELVPARVKNKNGCAALLWVRPPKDCDNNKSNQDDGKETNQ